MGNEASEAITLRITSAKGNFTERFRDGTTVGTVINVCIEKFKLDVSLIEDQRLVVNGASYGLDAASTTIGSLGLKDGSRVEFAWTDKSGDHGHP